MTREEAITILKDISWQMGSVKRWENIEAIDMAIDALQAEPVKHGAWVETHIGEITSWYVECSECHVVMPPVNYSYCPNCGADMRGK